MADKYDLPHELYEMGLLDPEATRFDEYDSAIIGTTEDGRIIYDYEKMVEFLCRRDGMSQEQAMEFVDYNAVRIVPVMGSRPPVIAYLIEQDPDDFSRYMNPPEEGEENDE